MSDKYGYIGLETLLNFCSNDKNHCVTPNDFMRMNRVKIEERPHGEWIKGKEISRTMLGDETLCIDYKNFTCSKCGLVLDRLLYNVDGSLFYKFCPNCGADMRKRDGDRND